MTFPFALKVGLRKGEKDELALLCKKPLQSLIMEKKKPNNNKQTHDLVADSHYISENIQIEKIK